MKLVESSDQNGSENKVTNAIEKYLLNSLGDAAIFSTTNISAKSPSWKSYLKKKLRKAKVRHLI